MKKRNSHIFYVILSNSCKAIFIIASIKESQFSEVNIFFGSRNRNTFFQDQTHFTTYSFLLDTYERPIIPYTLNTENIIYHYIKMRILLV